MVRSGRRCLAWIFKRRIDRFILISSIYRLLTQRFRFYQRIYIGALQHGPFRKNGFDRIERYETQICSKIKRVKENLEKLRENNKQNPLEELEKLIATLRGNEGCPWDKKQTPQSITVYLIEEVYELVDAIQSMDSNLVLEELGDVLFQVFFLSHLFSEAGCFDLNKVIITNIKKMKRRHPHVFGNETIKSAEQVKSRWQEIKRQEKKNHSKPNSLLNSIPNGLPALLRAYRISERAASIGFDWDNIEEVMEQVKEEWNEFVSEIRGWTGLEKKDNNAAMEFGDILFSLVNIARFAKIHPETALVASIQKFEQRFKFMEKTAILNGQKLEALSRNEWDNLWQKAKQAV